MVSKLLKGKQILAVDDKPEELDIIEKELLDNGALPDRAYSYEEAIQKISSLTYDLVILDIMGVREFELLEHAVARRIPAVVLTANALGPESLKHSIELGARAYLPKDQPGQLAPFLEDVLYLSYHTRLGDTCSHGWADRSGPISARTGGNQEENSRNNLKRTWKPANRLSLSNL